MNSLSDMCFVDLQDFNEYEYIGITVENGKIKIIFPKGYRLSINKNELRKDVVLLLKVLDKYREKGDIYFTEDSFLSHKEGNSFPIFNAIWLLKDYNNNGLYSESVYDYSTDRKGDIHWSRTIKKQIPYINNNDLVYLDFIVRKKNNDLTNVIRLMQKYILEICIENIGWLYPSVSIDKGNNLPFSVGACINILRNELRLNNLDNRKQLIKNMIDFLLCVGNDKSNHRFKEYKTKYFMNIWEHMLKVVFGNENEREYYPNAKWNINGESKDASNLRPDIVLKIDDKLYVIDAKYYKYGITKKIRDLPQSSDITKQLLYSSHISSDKGLKAYDAFILPFAGDEKELLYVCGNATIEINEFKYKKVVCILADIKMIMKLYISMDNLEQHRNNIKILIDNENDMSK